MSARQPNPKVSCTRNYRLFARSDQNRPTDATKHKRLLDSMKLYGFIPSFPLVCSRNGDKHLVIKDGQHRLMFAEQLDLPVYYTVDETDFDVAIVNSTPKTWTLNDYAQKFAACGKKAYAEIIEFADLHGVPIGTAVALLAGTVSYTNAKGPFIGGTFVVKDREWADLVGSLYAAMVAMSSEVRNARFLEACMYACRVKSFDPARLTRNAKRCREKLVSYSTRDAYLDMMESIYNFGSHKLMGLKAAATMVMRERNAVAAKARTR